MSATVGYSGKPLAAKLGIKPGQTVTVVAAPDHYRALLEPLPEGVRLVEAAAIEAGAGAEIIHLFVRDRADLAARAAAAVQAVSPGCALWVSWPKKSSPLFVDLTDGGVRAALLPTGLVDVKVAAVDADWSGLKFLWRRT
jgi:bifunctional DNA-binding transcriptional regulator/antitoxin component of YhaV-PrlF toxin-antitoxin module